MLSPHDAASGVTRRRAGADGDLSRDGLVILPMERYAAAVRGRVEVIEDDIF
jgi:hypothetical protein